MDIFSILQPEIAGQLPVDYAGTDGLDPVHQHVGLHHHHHPLLVISLGTGGLLVNLFVNPVTLDPSKETLSISSVLFTETSQGSLEGTENNNFRFYFFINSFFWHISYKVLPGPIHLILWVHLHQLHLQVKCPHYSAKLLLVFLKSIIFLVWNYDQKKFIKKKDTIKVLQAEEAAHRLHQLQTEEAIKYPSPGSPPLFLFISWARLLITSWAIWQTCVYILIVNSWKIPILQTNTDLLQTQIRQKVCITDQRPQEQTHLGTLQFS